MRKIINFLCLLSSTPLFCMDTTTHVQQVESIQRKQMLKDEDKRFVRILFRELKGKSLISDRKHFLRKEEVDRNSITWNEKFAYIKLCTMHKELVTLHEQLNKIEQLSSQYEAQKDILRLEVAGRIEIEILEELECALCDLTFNPSHKKTL